MRLLIVNNMPAYYRTKPFATLIDEFTRRTGGSGLVSYQVRRDPFGRGEWFYTPDEEIPFDHQFCSPATTRRSRVTAYPPKVDLTIFRRYRPTHIFAAGWDSPMSAASAVHARTRSSTLGTWVESNPSTSVRSGVLSNGYRRLFLRSSSFTLVPTEASARYVRGIAGASHKVVTALNPVSWNRLEDSDDGAGRLVFLGDLSARKGFDLYAEALSRAPELNGVAWGRDVEGLGRSAPTNCRVHDAAPLGEVVNQLRSGDVIVIPSRTDPAPLTYSEALALGLRVVVSDQIAYAAHASATTGATPAQVLLPGSIVLAARRLWEGPRPAEATAAQVTPAYWASRVLDGLLG